MARDLTNDFKTAITAATVRPVLLLTAHFDTGIIRLWNGEGDLTLDANEYTGAGYLLKIDPIVETQKTEARGLRTELTGMPSAIVALALAEDYQGRNITVDFALLEADGTVILDPYRFFSGEMDIMEIEEGAEFSTIALSAENDLIALKRVNERRRTPEDQKLTYPGDTFFDHVAAMQDKAITWGKDVTN